MVTLKISKLYGENKSEESNEKLLAGKTPLMPKIPALLGDRQGDPRTGANRTPPIPQRGKKEGERLALTNGGPEDEDPRAGGTTTGTTSRARSGRWLDGSSFDGYVSSVGGTRSRV